MKKIAAIGIILCMLLSFGVVASAEQKLVIGYDGEWTTLTSVINNSYGYFEEPYMKIKGAQVTTWNETQTIPGFGTVPLYVVEAKGECTLRAWNTEIMIRNALDGTYPGTIDDFGMGNRDVTLGVGTYELMVNIGGDGFEVKLYVTAPDPVFTPAPEKPALPEAGVIFNGQALVLDQSAVIVEGRVLVPARAILEAMGLQVGWDGATKGILAVKEGKRIEMKIDSKVAYVDKIAVVLDVPPQIIGDRTLVPIRFVSESCDAEVNWDDATKTVIINY